jgi:RNA polymerase sigma-70 factor (ECF subfamily)
MAGPGVARSLEERADVGDEEIVREVLAGAHGRFGELVRRHRARLGRVARVVLRDPHEAEDVVQQAFLQAFASLDRWAGTAPFGTWIARIAMNEALLRARRSRRIARAAIGLLADEPAAGTPEQEAASREEVQHVEAALPRLARRDREVLQLAAVGELPHADVAARLGVTRGAVKVRLHRARAALRGLVEHPDGPAWGRTEALARREAGGARFGGPRAHRRT